MNPRPRKVEPCLTFVAMPPFVPTIEARTAGVREAPVRRKFERPPVRTHVRDPEDIKSVPSWVRGRRWDALVCGNDTTQTAILDVPPGSTKSSAVPNLHEPLVNHAQASILIQSILSQ
jgi:hypothetical protein